MKFFVLALMFLAFNLSATTFHAPDTFKERYYFNEDTFRLEDFLSSTSKLSTIWTTKNELDFQYGYTTSEFTQEEVTIPEPETEEKTEHDFDLQVRTQFNKNYTFDVGLRTRNSTTNIESATDDLKFSRIFFNSALGYKISNKLGILGDLSFLSYGLKNRGFSAGSGFDINIYQPGIGLSYKPSDSLYLGVKANHLTGKQKNESVFQTLDSLDITRTNLQLGLAYVIGNSDSPLALVELNSGVTFVQKRKFLKISLNGLYNPSKSIQLYSNYHFQRGIDSNSAIRHNINFGTNIEYRNFFIDPRVEFELTNLNSADLPNADYTWYNLALRIGYRFNEFNLFLAYNGSNETLELNSNLPILKSEEDESSLRFGLKWKL